MTDTPPGAARAGQGAGWDAGLYDRSFGFVAAFGSDMLDLLAPEAGERIVDLGCGTGTLTAAIAERGAEVIGIDGDAAMVERARALHPHLAFEHADGRDFAIPGAADAVFSNAALHWMKEEPAQVIACVARALRPGGRFVAEMGAHRNVRIITDALYRALAEEGVPAEAVDFPWYFPRTSRYVALLEDGGFDVVQLHYFARPTPPLDDRHAPTGSPTGSPCSAVELHRRGVPNHPQHRRAREGACRRWCGDRTVALTRAEFARLCPDGRWVTDRPTPTHLRFGTISARPPPVRADRRPAGVASC